MSGDRVQRRSEDDLDLGADHDLAVLATGAALVSLITLGMTRVVAVPLYHHLLDRFFWTNLTLAALEWSGVALLIGLSWVIHGLMATLLAPVLASGSR